MCISLVYIAQSYYNARCKNLKLHYGLYLHTFCTIWFIIYPCSLRYALILSTFFLSASLPSTHPFIHPAIHTFHCLHIRKPRIQEKQTPWTWRWRHTFLRNATRHVVACHNTKWQQQAWSDYPGCQNTNTFCVPRNEFQSTWLQPAVLQRPSSNRATVVCFLLGNYLASEFYMPAFRSTLSIPSS